MHSAIYRGYVRHRRFFPHSHRFVYRVFMMYLDLDELPMVLALSPLWSDKPWRPARFVRDDFLGDAHVALDQAVRARIYEQTGDWHDGPIRLLANLRYFGYAINPIACYYCFDADENLRYLVVEVTNTPWGERQSYVLACDPSYSVQRIDFNKQMHVSPFNPMQMNYRWCSNSPAKLLRLNLEAVRQSQVQLDATLTLKRCEIDRNSLNATLAAHPWMSGKIAAAIYWQAFKLWLKRTPFYDHPATRSDLARGDNLGKIKSKS